nr:hypothetical protein CFP56_28673 [Quercus suber]
MCCQLLIAIYVGDVVRMLQERHTYTRPDYLAWDPLSGDNGVNIALHVLSTRAVAVNDAALGGWSGFGAVVTQSGTNVNIKPTDSARQRIFIASNALYLELDAGRFQSVTYDTSLGTVTVVFDSNKGFSPNARLRWTTSASTPESGTYKISGTYPIVRECSVIPLSTTSTTTVTLSRS